MSTQVQWRRGNASEHATFTGANAEITVDTTNWTLRVHDGTTQGGYQLVSNLATQTLFNKTINSATLSGATTTISGNLIPSSNVTYSLGSSTNRFKDLWLSGTTIHLDGATIGVTDSQLSLTSPGGGQFVIESGGNYNLNAIDANIGTIKVLLDNEIDFVNNLNGNLFSYQFYANTSLDSINANVGAYQIYANANVVTIKNKVNTLDANVGAYEIYANANVGTIRTNLDSLDSNIGAYQTFANANVVAIQANIGAYQSFANANVVAIQTNVSEYQTYANSNAAIQQTQINNIISQANANTAAYITTYSGSIGGTLTTASQPNITTLAGLTSFGPSFGDTTAQGNLTILGNLTVQGNTITIGSDNLTVTDSIIDLHTSQDLSVLVSDDGRDIGFRFHYYKGYDDHAFFGWENDTQTLIYLQRSDEVNSNITGTYGNVQFGSLLLSNTTAATSTTTGAFQVRGGAGINGALYILNTGDVSANIGSYQTFANANVVSLQNQITGANNNIQTLNANIGSYQTYANANVVTIQANIGAFYTYANTKIGTNTNSNLVVVSNTQSISTTTGALISAGGHAITTGNLYIGGSGGNSVVATGDIYNQGNIWITNTTNAGLKTNQTTAYVYNETATTVRIGGAATALSIGAAGADTLTFNATTGSMIPGANATVNLGSSTAYWGTTFTGNIVSNAHVVGAGGLISAANIVVPGINTGTTNGNLLIDPNGSGWVVFTPVTPLWFSNVLYNVSNIQATSTTSGGFQLTGGMGIATGNLYVGGSAGTAIVATGNIIPSGNVVNTNNIGSDTAWWGNFYGVATQARYADLAENYQADTEYDPGTVLVFGGANEVTISSITHDTAVAGVVSTNPAHLMNGALRGPNVVPLALQGRVPCLVQGPVNKGTPLVTSNTPGVAEAINYSLHRPGCVLGKSLEVIEDNTIKLIEVVVGRF